MSSEFFDEDKAVQELKSRLRCIKEALIPLTVEGQVDPLSVPKDIREEIVQILDEHGGIDLLSSLTKLTFNTINSWHRRWIYNPYIYRTPTDPARPKKTNALIKKVLNPTPKEAKLTKNQQVITNESSTAQKLTWKLTPLQEKTVKNIKNLMEEKIREGAPLDEEVEEAVKELYNEIGDAREVAILLGISKDIIEEWVFDLDFSMN
jgi:hypothetical protein